LKLFKLASVRADLTSELSVGVLELFNSVFAAGKLVLSCFDLVLEFDNFLLLRSAKNKTKCVCQQRGQAW
jgi:hypothetical protein